ncbi:MAG: hypothetical protein ACM30H_14630 [Clostridia bacterium]
MPQAVRLRALKRATEILGGAREVGKFLDVPLARVTDWLYEVEPVPETAFLRLVDVIIEHDALESLKVRRHERPRGQEHDA